MDFINRCHQEAVSYTNIDVAFDYFILVRLGNHRSVYTSLCMHF